jgi:hypothetical protein
MGPENRALSNCVPAGPEKILRDLKCKALPQSVSTCLKGLQNMMMPHYLSTGYEAMKKNTTLTPHPAGRPEENTLCQYF